MGWLGGNYYLTYHGTEQLNNVVLFYNYMIQRDFTLEAICGMLGNIQSESGVNPFIWEGLSPYTIYGRSSGWGLVQWTPYTKFQEWAGENWQTDGDLQCGRIVYEFNNGLQYSTQYQHSLPVTADEFRHSTATPTYLADVFLRNYENPAVIPQPARGEQAEYWYEYLQGFVPPTPPEPPTPPVIYPEFKFIYYLKHH